jgi:hypothetical protein
MEMSGGTILAASSATARAPCPADDDATLMGVSGMGVADGSPNLRCSDWITRRTCGK